MTTVPAPTLTQSRAFVASDWALLLAPAAIWGSSFLFTAEALEHFEPGLVTWLRVLFGFCMVMALPGARRPLPRAARPKAALVGFFWMAFPLTLFPIAQQWINSSIAGLLNASMPLFTALIGWSVFRVSTTGRRLAGVMIGFSGILLIGVPTARVDGTSALGVVLVLAAVASYGVAVNISAPLQAEYSLLPVLAHALGVALVLVTPGGIVGATGSTFAWSALLQCIWLGALGTGIAFVCSSALGRRHGALPMAVIAYFIPIVSTVLGRVFRDETLGSWVLVGGAVVLVGAWFATQVSRR